MVRDAPVAVLQRLPFELVKAHRDSSVEFLNHRLLRYFGERASGVTWSRSRPY